MVLGLPVICLDWGGPSLLVTPECGVPIEPRGEEHVIAETAAAMDRLAEDGAPAERMSIAARGRAPGEGFLWPDIFDDWIAIDQELLASKAGA
jgi:glycosyltransferase involved in cell wall biosynthesis